MSSFADYRKIKGLIFIGPEEWQQAMTSRVPNNPNPLGLSPGWCQAPPCPWTPDQILRLVDLCQTREWSTIPILWLALPEVGGKPTSLATQHKWWGIPSKDLPGGSIKQDVFYSNWYLQGQAPWVIEPAVPEPKWMIGYECPYWTLNKDWATQQAAASERGMVISTAAQAALMLNLVRIAGERLRHKVWSRVSIIYDGDGCPLFVDSRDYGVGVDQGWDPGNAYDNVAASVQGVPSELGF